MNGIIGIASLLLDTELTPEQQLHVTLPADAGRSLIAIINDILDLSKVEAGKIDLEAIALSPADLVDGALAFVRGVALEKGLALDVTIAPDVPSWVDGDPTRLRQILLNLLTNALKFTEHGRVGITVRPELHSGKDHVRFEISDTGIGIALEKQHLLFEKVSQVDRADARKYGGSGLGLAISRLLAEAMSGTIGVTSEIGAGSVFWFTAQLPATAAPLRRPIQKGGETMSLGGASFSWTITRSIKSWQEQCSRKMGTTLWLSPMAPRSIRRLSCFPCLLARYMRARKSGRASVRSTRCSKFAKPCSRRESALSKISQLRRTAS